MCAIEFPDFAGRFGPDPERVSRVYHFAHTQPSWAARMAGFILAVMLLLVLIVILLPLILLAMLVVGAMLLAARLRVAMGGAGGSGAGPGVVDRVRSAFSRGVPATGGRKNVRVRRREP